MLERVNSSQKIIGHNRFQQKIEELENFIEKDKKYKAEQLIEPIKQNTCKNLFLVPL